MHWGIRRFQNEDGSLTPAGKIRYGSEQSASNTTQDTVEKDRQQRKLAKSLRPGKPLPNLPEGTPEHKDLMSAIDGVKKVEKVENDYWNNVDLVKKYATMAAKYAYKNEGFPKEWTEQDVINWYLYDDGDQGERDSFYFYMKDTGRSMADYQKKRWEAYDKYDSALDSYVDSALGPYKRRTIKYTQKKSAYKNGRWVNEKRMTSAEKYLKGELRSQYLHKYGV